MTPKEKAMQIFNRMCNSVDELLPFDVKQCALIAVDEIIDLLPNINLIPPIQRKPDEFYFQYWHSVKQEIEKL